VNQFLRSADPGHRAALLAVWRRSSWEPLIAGLKARSADADAAPSPVKLT